MNEKAPQSEGNLEEHDDSLRETDNEHKKQVEHRKETHQPVEAQRDSIDEILKKIEHEAAPAKEIMAEVIEEENDAAKEDVAPASGSLKNHAMKQSLRKIQRKLPASQRAFSKVVHQPLVEQVSDVTGATIARPSGVLVGGLFSVIASIGVLIACRHYGYEYNFTIGLMAFVGGFVAGLLLELAFRVTGKSKSH